MHSCSDFGTMSIVCVVWALYQLMPQNEVPGGISQIRCPPYYTCFYCKGQIWNQFQMHPKFSLSHLVSSKKLSCFRISGFELSLESCSPLPISLTALLVACCVENKCTLIFMFITSFPFFTSFFQHAHNKYGLSYKCSFARVHNKRTFFSPALADTAPSTQWNVAEALWGYIPHLGMAEFALIIL